MAYSLLHQPYSVCGTHNVPGQTRALFKMQVNTAVAAHTSDGFNGRSCNSKRVLCPVWKRSLSLSSFPDFVAAFHMGDFLSKHLKELLTRSCSNPAYLSGDCTHA